MDTSDIFKKKKKKFQDSKSYDWQWRVHFCSRHETPTTPFVR